MTASDSHDSHDSHGGKAQPSGPFSEPEAQANAAADATTTAAVAAANAAAAADNDRPHSHHLYSHLLNHAHQHRRLSLGMMHDDDVHYADVVNDGRPSSVALDHSGHIAYASLVPPAVESPGGSVNGTVHSHNNDAADALERQPTATCSDAGSIVGASAGGAGAGGSSSGGAAMEPVTSSPQVSRHKIKRSESGVINTAATRRATRDRSSTLPSSLKRTTSDVALVRALRKTAVLHWDLDDMPTHLDDGGASSGKAGKAAATTTQQQQPPAAPAPTPTGGIQPASTRMSFWKRQAGDGTTTSTYHSYRNFLRSQALRRDGRLPISVKDTNHTGVLAKAVGAAVRRITHDNPDAPDTDDTDEDPNAYAAAQNEADLSPAAAEFGRISHNLAHAKTPRLNIVIMVIGSRGDIQPFLKIGKVLKNKYGHRVRVATHPAFRDFIEKDAGLEFFSIGGDPAELMAFMVKNPGMIPSLATVRAGDIGRRRDAMAEMFDGFWRSCVDATDDPNDIHNLKLLGDKEPFIADAIIANPPSYVHVHCAEALGVPLHIMFTFPYTPTQAFPHPLANIKKSTVDPGYTNFISYPLIDMMVWQGLGDLVNKFRVRTLDLEPITMIWAPGAMYRMHVPFTYLWSPGLIPKPEDWGPEIDIGGFVFLELASAFHPPDSLVQFLAASDEKPIYIGFGSIVVDDADSFTDMIFEAIRKTGVRALISKGWGGFGGNGDNLPDNVYMLENTPHDWLFPQVRACVIHGGAGTTAIALKCGLPTMVVPFFGDQYFWGSMIEKSKVGPKPVPYKRLTADGLAEGITYLLSDEARVAAQGIAACIAKEGDGAENACHSFMRTLELEGQSSMRCSIFPDRVAVWQRKASNIKLSPLAAEALVERGCLSYRNLRLIRSTEWNDFEGPGEPISAMFGSIARSFGAIVTSPFAAMGEIISTSKKTKAAKKERKAQKAKAKAAAKADKKKAQAEKEKKKTGSTPDNDGHNNSTSTRDLAEADTLHDGNDDDNSLGGGAGSSKAEEGSFEVVFQAVGKGVGRSALALAMAPIDVYFAICQGFHNAPRLYGDDTVRRTPHVTGIKSGLRAAGNEFVYGIFDGVTGVVRLPIRHARNGGGAHGFVKGIGMGLMGFVLKDISAGISPLAFTLKGLAKQADRSRQPTRYLRRARIVQGQREARALGEPEWQKHMDKAAASWETMHELFKMVQEEGHGHEDGGGAKNTAPASESGRPAMPRNASNDSIFEQHHYHHHLHHYHHHGVGSSARQSLENLDAALENADLAAVVLAAMRRGETLESVVRGRHNLPAWRQQQQRRRQHPCHLCGPQERDLSQAFRKQLTERWQDKTALGGGGGGGGGDEEPADVGGPSGTHPDDVD